MTSFERFIFFRPLPVWPRPMAAVLLAFVPNVAANPPTSKMNHVTPGSAAPLTKQSVPDDQNPPVILVDAVFVPPCRDKTWSDDALLIWAHTGIISHTDSSFPSLCSTPFFFLLQLSSVSQQKKDTSHKNNEVVVIIFSPPPQHVLMIDPI